MADKKAGYGQNMLRARDAEQGSALIYILIAIALLALLTVTFMEPSSQQTQTQNTFKVVSELQSQADFIRTSVQECVLRFPGGDVTIPDAYGVNKRYPIDPNSDHLPAASRSGNRNVERIRCPGQTVSGPDDHQLVFGGATGKFLPPPPPLFGAWQWYNGPDGIFFWTTTDKTDSFLKAALERLDENFSDCEADVIDSTAGNKSLDDDGEAVCLSGTTCFRVWVIAKDATYPDEPACNTP